MIAQEYGFPTDELEVADRARHTAERVEELLSEERPVLARVNLLLSAALPGAPPDRDDMMPSIARDADDLGFRPVCRMTWGHWPLPAMKTPIWIGPEGFVALEVYKPSRRDRTYRYCLRTYFDDGNAIATTLRDRSMNARTRHLVGSGDLEADYREHLAEAQDYVNDSGATPLYRPKPEHNRACWHVYAYHHTPLGAVPVLLALNLAILGLAGYAIYWMITLSHELF